MSSNERESWGNHCEFFLTSLGLAVGLGNVWRFPYVCYTNGAGSFLIPYILMLLIVGIPALFVESSIGQYGRAGANKVFGRLTPIFKGLGYGMLVVRFLVNVYYVVICAWALFYLCAGFTANLPWKGCVNSWNTDDCYDIDQAEECNPDLEYEEWNMTFYQKVCVTKEHYCQSHGYSTYDAESEVCIAEDLSGMSDTNFTEVLQSRSISPAEDYLNGRVLGLTKDFATGEQYDWYDFGGLRWELCLCLLLAWLLVVLSLIKGLQSLGKAAYVITLSPYFVLTALLIYTTQLEGSGNGISYYLAPEWDKLAEVQIWSKAASQILFSLSVGFGSQLVLSSYNQFKNNTQRDSILISICNSLTSIYAGFVVFSILGYLEYKTKSPIDQVVQGGISLAFVSYPTAVLEMTPPPLWSFLFFFMLINLALSSICGGVQTFIAFILDEKPEWNRHRVKIVIIVCIIYFLLGLPMCMNGGIHLFTIFDKRTTSSLLFITMLEIIIVAWFYGVNQFFKAAKEMDIPIPTFVAWLWRIMLVVVTPLLLAIITILSWINHEDMAYNNYVYPNSVQICGWVMELLPLGITAVYPLWTLCKARSKEGRMIDLLFKPTDSWFEAHILEEENAAAADLASRKSSTSRQSRKSLKSTSSKSEGKDNEGFRSD
ncbi:hypothetical protein TCAL_11783 [Tigriopus californicus]|uniref:Transporter n=1 Tax=Tigriopus californicus TaxID=6832 RepID=A0A553PFF0_TIGCA|nr:sodium- and chloride-dependent GABA transporter 1-like [Tigriopus californicus]TRY76399.1 hypothetical protein TCAL_11783 [Tigriopus californicus]